MRPGLLCTSACACLLLTACLPLASAAEPSADATIPQITVPFSAYASPEAEKYYATQLRDVHPSFGLDVLAARKYWDQWNAALVEHALKIYDVTVRPETIGGVQTDVVVPAKGIAPRNRNRVLINLHGGAFAWGARYGGQAESIPVAALGRIEVITVDYREGPEYRFPAASEDVAAVYRELLKRYRPENIGIYGCSAGGILAAEAVAWFQAHDLPRPGAISMMCASAGEFDGDSAFLAPVLSGDKPVPSEAARPTAAMLPYFHGVDMTDPLVEPLNSEAVLKKFPPTLFITGTRDFALSAAVTTDNKLAELGVETELRIWDGMWHAFMVIPELPESRAAYRATAEFFDRHLGQAPQGPGRTR